MNKLNQVINIINQFNGDKKSLLNEVQSRLNITRSNASVYVYKALKNTSIPKSKTTKVISIPEYRIPSIITTPIQQVEYEEAMMDRVSRGYSRISIEEYFHIKDNLKELFS